MLHFIQGLILGAVQGITEFFPVSSSGHLALVPAFFGWRDQGLAFDAVLHLGTLCTLIVFFWKDLVSLTKRSFSSDQALHKDAWIFIAKVAAAAAPALLIAFFTKDWIEANVRAPVFVAFNLVLWGFLLFLADRTQERRGSGLEKYDQLSWKQALIIGFVQPFSLLPGTSRSGSTITAGLFAKMSRESAAKFSFFLSIPITGAAGAYGILKTVTSGAGPDGAMALIVGFLSAFLFGLFAIRFLLSYVAKKRYDIFVLYRFALALLVVLFVKG